MQYSKEQKAQKYKNLPEDVQKVIFGADTAGTIKEIGKNYKLNVRQVGILADEAGLLMLGINPPGDFVKNLNKRLDGVDKETIKKIADEINTRIFAKIRESLRKVHGISEDKKKEGLHSEASAKEGPSPESLEGTSEPMSHIIKPRTAPFVVSQKKPEMEDITTPTEEKPISYPAPAPAGLPTEKKNEQTEVKKDEPVEVKSVVEERKKEEGFRSKPSFTEVKLPAPTLPKQSRESSISQPNQKDLGEVGKETKKGEEKKKKAPPKKPTYKGGTDPYREPVD